MLKHFNIVVLFLLSLFVLLYIDQSSILSPWYYVILVLVFLFLEVYGAASIQSGFHLPAFFRKDTKEKIVALTFDDGPSANTLKVLEVLARHGAQATFFCIGKNLEGNETIVKQAYQEGHTLANHSYSHNFWFDLKTTAAMEADLLKATDSIRQCIGKSPVYFRPPYGVTTPALARAVKKLKYHCIGWNIRSFDTKGHSADQVLKRIEKALRPGSIILLHDTISGTELVTDKLLSFLKEQNYKVVPLVEMLQKPAYA